MEPFAHSSPAVLQLLGRYYMNKQEAKHFCFLGRKRSASSCQYPLFLQYCRTWPCLCSGAWQGGGRGKAPAVTIRPEFLACRVRPCRCSSGQWLSNPDTVCHSSDRRSLLVIAAKWKEGTNGTTVLRHCLLPPQELNPQVSLRVTTCLFCRVQITDSTEIPLCAVELSCLDNWVQHWWSWQV